MYREDPAAWARLGVLKLLDVARSHSGRTVSYGLEKADIVGALTSEMIDRRMVIVNALSGEKVENPFHCPGEADVAAAVDALSQTHCIQENRHRSAKGYVITDNGQVEMQSLEQRLFGEPTVEEKRIQRHLEAARVRQQQKGRDDNVPQR